MLKATGCLVVLWKYHQLFSLGLSDCENRRLTLINCTHRAGLATLAPTGVLDSISIIAYSNIAFGPFLLYRKTSISTSSSRLTACVTISPPHAPLEEACIKLLFVRVAIPDICLSLQFAFDGEFWLHIVILPRTVTGGCTVLQFKSLPSNLFETFSLDDWLMVFRMFNCHFSCAGRLDGTGCDLSHL